MTLANNHLMDYREQATKQTVELLKKYKMKYTGVVFGEPFTKQVGGIYFVIFVVLFMNHTT